MAITLTRLGTGYLFGDTGVQPGAHNAGDGPLVCVLARANSMDSTLTDVIGTPTDTQGNNWSHLLTFTNGVGGAGNVIKFYWCDGSKKIKPADGDVLNLDGDNSYPVMWALWELKGGIDLERGSTNTGDHMNWNGTSFSYDYTPGLNRQGGVIIWASIMSERETTQGASWGTYVPDTSGSGGVYEGTGRVQCNDSWDSWYFGSSGVIATPGTSYYSGYNFEPLNPANGDNGGHTACVRFLPWRTVDRKKPRAAISAVSRASRF